MTKKREIITKFVIYVSSECKLSFYHRVYGWNVCDLRSNYLV